MRESMKTIVNLLGELNVKRFNLFFCILTLPWMSFAQEHSENKENSNLETNYTLGIGIASLPKFSGSDIYETRVLPIIYAQYGRLHLGGVSGIRYEITSTDDLKVSATLGYFRGRDESDADYLKGLGDIESSVTAGMAITKSIGLWRFGASLNRDFSDDVGGISADLSAGYTYKLSPQFMLSINSKLSWIDSNYANGIYSISNKQANSSTLLAYKAQSGLESVALSFSGLFFINKNWILTTIFSQNQLLNSAKESPINRDANPYFIMSSVSYRF